jgi:hypothetical protein
VGNEGAINASRQADCEIKVRTLHRGREYVITGL